MSKNSNYDIREWKKKLAPFEKPRVSASTWQLVNSVGPFLLLWVLAYLSLEISFWLTLLCAVPAAGFLVRTFIIFHDCTHYSFFKSRKANEIVGIITGLFTFCAFEQWKRTHTTHHASNGNLEKRGVGDVWTMTLQEYADATPFKRIAYRIYRNPIVMFLIGPLYIFLIDYRFNAKTASPKEKRHVWLTNVALVTIVCIVGFTIGWKEYILVQLPIFYVATFSGVWLFYVQHQFEDGYFEHNENWNFVEAALKGSSYYKLPKILQWFSGNIGYHHVHHLNSRVPNYLLEQAHNSDERLQDVPTLTLLTSLKSLTFKLWDDRAKKFIGNKDIREFIKQDKTISG
ncbi:fatty acid desaturase [Halalkalibacter akibai]|uniref:Delta5 acyl-lipid desaturase n=1 Tax=Halalkalibacter akibai (strain ATCC 43226 / DSM 21942 / CIP 109018 / JCM 9157 / 1139) TaxID=1236973 RepID=W4QXE6_HALA3|nr:fatty acid desaturase [Halalkalibacter akibai]GAE36805.1 delta5 acyl-lipid desaturase [Halalkalibacter akibai JCM 9157]